MVPVASRASVTATTESSGAAVRELVREAVGRRAAVRIVGAGTWLDAGAPVQASEIISTAALSGIVEYVPGDLTLTAGAGTPLATIVDATRAESQWLALDPLGGDRGTLGATLATASFGPLASGFGTPRDLALGIEYVTGRGELARAGGRVVKNVAGFDMTRLMTGAWGTLGIITEVTVRLHARPERDVSVVIPLGDKGLGAVSRFLRAWPFTALACEVVNRGLASTVGVSTDAAILMRLAGNADSVAAQLASLGAFGDFREMDVQIWDRLRQAWDSKWTFRLSRKRSEIEQVWSMAAAMSEKWPGTLISASPWRAVVRCALPPEGGSARQLVELLSTRPEIVRVYERLPAESWPAIGQPAPNEIAQRIKAAFDPQGVLNPSILGHLA